MPLAASTRLGPYEIVAPIGAGGMGEVYRARDTRLEREVAVKILPEAFAKDEQRRQRFEREARAISALNHPHVCALFDVGQDNGTHFIVMELLEGETLLDRLAKGPLPPEHVLRYGAQIADALDAAHRHGMVHRDLKPGNVVLTRTGAKLLDFGLARHTIAVPSTSASDIMTAARPLTEAGSVLGTYQYMAPEQLEGREADARSDIFALGAVLYEMATARRAFPGQSPASLMAAMISSRPAPISSVAPSAPPALDHVVRKCLETDAEDRWQSARDIAEELRWISQAGSQAGVAASVVGRRRTREAAAWTMALLATVAAAWAFLSRPAPPPAAPRRTHILLPPGVRLNNAVLSPDARRLVFSGTDTTGRVQLWLRPLDAFETTPIPGTDGGVVPFWSPDGESVGFTAGQALKRVAVTGGGVPVVVAADVDAVGGAWAPSGDILYCRPTGPILRLAGGSGTAVPVTRLDEAHGETSHRYPFFLPDGRHFLYVAMNTAGNRQDPANRLWVGSLDGSPAKPLMPSTFGAQYARGRLLFMRGGTLGGSLFSQALDVSRLEVSGEAVTVASQVALYGDYLGFGDYSVARDGTLVFDATQLLTRLEWYDRTGKPLGVLGEPGLHSSPSVAPDGTRVAFDLYDSATQTTQIWFVDEARGVRTRVTSGPSSNAGAIWSPDGSSFAFQSDRRHQADVIVHHLDSGAEDAFSDEDGQKIPQGFSPDGRTLVVFDREPKGSRRVGLSTVPVSGEHKFQTVVPKVPEVLGGGRISADGRWLAYDSNESGRREVYVVAFPSGQNRVQISSAGGEGARWTQGGREILYTSFDGTVTAVEIEAGTGGLRASKPKPLFQLPSGTGSDWDVTARGDRFLLNVPVTKSSSVPLSLVENGWTEAASR